MKKARVLLEGSNTFFSTNHVNFKTLSKSFKSLIDVSKSNHVTRVLYIQQSAYHCD